MLPEAATRAQADLLAVKLVDFLLRKANSMSGHSKLISSHVDTIVFERDSEV